MPAIVAGISDPGAYRQKRDLLAAQGKADAAHHVLLAMAQGCAADPDVLAEVAAELASTPDLKRRDLTKALELADKAVELTKGREADILAVQARVHYELGHLARAAQIANQAVVVAPEVEAEEFKAAAAFYRNELARRRRDPDAKL